MPLRPNAVTPSAVRTSPARQPLQQQCGCASHVIVRCQLSSPAVLSPLCILEIDHHRNCPSKFELWLLPGSDSFAGCRTFAAKHPGRCKAHGTLTACFANSTTRAPATPPTHCPRRGRAGHGRSRGSGRSRRRQHTGRGLAVGFRLRGRRPRKLQPARRCLSRRQLGAGRKRPAAAAAAPPFWQ